MPVGPPPPEGVVHNQGLMQPRGRHLAGSCHRVLGWWGEHWNHRRGIPRSSVFCSGVEVGGKPQLSQGVTDDVTESDCLGVQDSGMGCCTVRKVDGGVQCLRYHWVSPELRENTHLGDCMLKLGNR